MYSVRLGILLEIHSQPAGVSETVFPLGESKVQKGVQDPENSGHVHLGIHCSNSPAQSVQPEPGRLWVLSPTGSNPKTVDMVPIGSLLGTQSPG